MNFLIKTGVFSLVCNYLRPSNNSRQLIFNINAVVLIVLTKMVKCLPEFEYFTVFLKNRNFISKIRRSKVTDYAALMKELSQYTQYTGEISMFSLFQNVYPFNILINPYKHCVLFV